MKKTKTFMYHTDRKKLVSDSKFICQSKMLFPNWYFSCRYNVYKVNKGNNKITELRTILQRESQNS